MVAGSVPQYRASARILIMLVFGVPGAPPYALVTMYLSSTNVARTGGIVHSKVRVIYRIYNAKRRLLAGRRVS